MSQTKAALLTTLAFFAGMCWGAYATNHPDTPFLVGFLVGAGVTALGALVGKRP